MKTKKLIAVLATVLLTAAVASAQNKSNLGTTMHGGLLPAGCIGCHTPHNGANGKILLWNPALPAGPFSTYGGGSLTKPADGTVAAAHSYLCLSCHDGTAAGTNATIINGLSPADMSGGTNQLTDDHPVDKQMPASDPAYELAATIVTNGVVRLFGATPNMVECGSCHDPHDSTTLTGNSTAYMRASMTANALCLACHK